MDIYEDGISQPAQSNITAELNKAIEFKMAYPDIYYKIQPYVLALCDEMDLYGIKMPSQGMMNQMVETIYDDVYRTYPELEGLSLDKAEEVNLNILNPFGYGHQGRNRGFLGDLINILLLTEIFGRRRRYFRF